MQLDKLFRLLQSGEQTCFQLFSVTAGGGGIPAGLTVMDALCQGKGIRPGEDHYSTWFPICGKVVKAVSRANMINHMSGERMDTALMKACANGCDTMVELLLPFNASSSHLGVITPPISLVYFYLVSLRKGISGYGWGQAPR